MLAMIGCQAQEATVRELPTEAAVATMSPTEPAPPTATMLSTVVAEVMVEPTVELLPTDTPEPVVDAVATIGRTPDGVFFLGAENAPVTVIDYSDFL